MTFNLIAGLLALFVLKPMRVRHFVKSRATYSVGHADVGVRASLENVSFRCGAAWIS